MKKILNIKNNENILKILNSCYRRIQKCRKMRMKDDKLLKNIYHVKINKPKINLN